ncbi:MAG: HEAT repeat domain-containing protein [Bacteroidetes bacterium]|nr:HEAT repeat domain-containing protein [Bacteroidota bacterium]
MKFIRIALIFIGIAVFVQNSEAQRVTDYEGNGSLGEAYAWALGESRSLQDSDGFYVAYSFSRMMCEHCYSGTRYDSEWDRLPSVQEIVTGNRMDKAARTIQEAARRELDKHERADKIVRKEIAVLIEFDRNGRVPTDFDVTNMTSSFDFGNRSLLWLGSASDKESIKLMASIYDSGATTDARKGAIWGVGMHDAPHLAIPFLSDVLTSRASDEFRKSAAYGLGNQEVDRSLRLLRSTVFGDRSGEVSKAAVYAMGNMDLSDATKALEEIVTAGDRLTVETRKAALYALGNRDERAALTTLKHVALGDHEVEIQKAATYAIGNIDLEGAVEALAEILDDAPKVEVQKAALYAISNNDQADAVKFLKSTAVSSKSSELAKAAVYALSNAVDENDVSPLMDVLRESEFSEVRKAAVYSIGNHEGSAALEALKFVLENDTSTEVRKAAVHALGNMDSDEARRVLLSLITDAK